MKSRRRLVVLFSLPFLLECSPPLPSLVWESVDAGLRSSLRGLSAVDRETAWVSGSNGAYAFTRDGGATWTQGTVPGADSLEFRDVEAFPDGTAYLMSAGPGASSRIYKTVDWGERWTLQHTNLEERGFFNGMAFWDRDSGVVVGDPVDGRLFLLVTRDGGEAWNRLSGSGLPEVAEGEYGFAASGTNIATFGRNGLAVVSGGTVARVFLTPDRGQSWNVIPTSMAAGNPSSGIFSIDFGGEETAVIVGGDYQDPDATQGTVGISTDGGMTWFLPPDSHMGFRSGVAWRDDASLSIWIAVGTPGSSYSLDDGESWTPFDTTALNAVAFAGPVGWAAGPEGRVARLLVR